MGGRRGAFMAYQPAGYPPQQPRGLGIAAFVLGIAAIITLLLCGLGAVISIVGVVIGIIAVARGSARGLAVAGLALSTVTLLVAIGAGIWIFRRVPPCTEHTRYPTKADRDRCMEHRVPFFSASSTPVPG